MHYYQFHIGDFRGATTHLSNDEELAYRRLLDWYYDTEKPIPLETQMVSRRLRVATETVDSVLRDFFTETPDGWVNDRCEMEISRYRDKAEKNRENGKKGGRPKGKIETQKNPVGSQSDASRNPVESDTNPNQEPITNNQEPVFKNISDQQAESPSPEAPKQPRRNWIKELVKLGVDEKHANDWMTARKQKKAPMTDTALEGVIREAAKAGITLDDAVKIAAENSWVGFKASWMDKAKTSHSAAPVNRQQQIEDANARVVQEIIERESQLNGSHGQSRGMFDLGDPITIEGEVIHAQ